VAKKSSKKKGSEKREESSLAKMELETLLRSMEPPPEPEPSAATPSKLDAQILAYMLREQAARREQEGLLEPALLDRELSAPTLSGAGPLMVDTFKEGGEVAEDPEKEARLDKYRAEAASEALNDLINGYRMTGRGAEDIARVTGLSVDAVSRMFGASDTSLPSAELARENQLGEFRETTPKVMTDEGTRLRPNYELRSVPKDLMGPTNREPLEDYIRRFNIQRSGVNPRVQTFDKGGEVSNDEFIQEMMTGTRPTDQEADPNVVKDIVRGVQYTPFDVLGAPVDIATMVMRPLGYNVEKPVGGSDWFIEQAVKRGLAQPSTGSGAELLGRIVGGVATPAAARGVGKVGQATEDFISGQLDTAARRVEENTLAKLREQTGNPNLTAKEVYDAMFAAQAPGAAITKPMGPTTAPVQAPQTPLGFYSAVEDTVLKLPQEKGTAQQLLAQISKAPGVKTKEVEATGLAEFLRSKGAAPVTKQEIQDFLANNRVQVDEVVLGKGQVISPEAKQRMGAAENRMIEIDNELINAPYFRNVSTDDNVGDTLARLRGPLARKAAAGDAEAMAEIDALNLPPDIKQLVMEFGEQKNEYQKYAKQSRRIEKPKFDKYNIPGGENAREIYLTLPGMQKQASFSLADKERLDELTAMRVENSLDGLSPAQQREYFALLNKREGSGALYTVSSIHSVSPEADKNRIAHIFLDDRTDAQGNKTLFVQELQSDWGQQGRDKGFAKIFTPDQLKAEEVLPKPPGPRLWTVTYPGGNQSNFAANTANEAIAFAIQAEGRVGSPLPAPFVTNTEDWLNLALKRVIKEAVDSGADNVAFIKGEQAANKYSLSTVLDNIEVMPFHPLHAFKGRLVDLKRKDGGIIELKVDDTGKVLDVSDSVFFREFANKPLSDIVGKEMSEKIMAVKPGEESVQFSAKDMEVGGQGMKAFYDNIVPKTANKLLEKLGSKVETIDFGRTRSRETWVQGRENPFRAEQNIDEPYEGRVKIVNTETGESRMFNTRDEADEYVAEALGHNVDQIHLGFKITPEMREIVKGQGLPQFAAGGEVTNFIRAHA